MRVHAGDIIFTADASGSVMHIVISGAQRVGSRFGPGNASSVHAAIATGNGAEVIESVGSGLKRRDLKTGTNFRSYCYRGDNMYAVRRRAVRVAKRFKRDRAYGEYAKFRAFKSVFRSHKGTRGVRTEHSSVFCSSFAWLCMTTAAEELGMGPIIEGGHSQIGPRDLEGKLAADPRWHSRNGGHKRAYNGVLF